MHHEASIKDKKYKLLLKQLDEILTPEDPILTNLSNFTAVINQTLSNLNWVGFYIVKDDILYLGPFQGKVACTQIKIGEGVCGLSAKLQQTQVVPDVHKFPGHIACDPDSNSEIVIPIILNGKVFGVLDLDSYLLANFDETDKEMLENICSLLVDRLELNKFLIH